MNRERGNNKYSSPKQFGVECGIAILLAVLTGDCSVPCSVPKLNATELEPARLLFDLRLCGELVRQFTGWLDADAIAKCTTDGLIKQFGCTFARIWLVNAERTSLRLVSSSGLYTRLDGSFSQVPMGAFKVGKIAQNCIPFLSNYLPDEAWVKDREWAQVNQIQGFAGLPLMVEDQAIGVLAVFSHQPMAPEFLEVLQILSMSVTGALASALSHQAYSRSHESLQRTSAGESLAEQLAAIMGSQKLSLLGKEQRLSPDIAKLFISTAQQLAALSCHYCRLVYETDTVTLEAMLEAQEAEPSQSSPVYSPLLQEIATQADSLGGFFQQQTDAHQKVIQVRLQLPQQSEVFESEPLSLKQSSKPLLSVSPLSDREQEVIELLTQGSRDKDIAEKLFISERTVKFHVKNMLKKMGVRTRVQAVFEATQQGWLR